MSTANLGAPSLQAHGPNGFLTVHIERALDEVTRFVRHKTLLPPGYQEEHTRLILVVKRRQKEKKEKHQSRRTREFT